MTPAEAIGVLERRALDAAFVKERGDSELEEVIHALVGNAGGFAELSAIRDAVRDLLIDAGWRYDWEGNGSFLPDDEIVPALREALAQRTKAIAIADAMVSRCLECADDREAHVEDDGIICTACGADFVVCVDGPESLEALNRWREYVEEGHRERVGALKGRLADVEQALHTTTRERDAARAALASGSDTRAHGIIAAALSALTDRPQMMAAAPEDLPKLVERLRVALEREREATNKLRSQYAAAEIEVRACVPGASGPLIPLVRRLAEERDAARAAAERERQRALLAEQLASHERGSNIPPRPLWPVASRIRAWLRGAR